MEQNLSTLGSRKYEEIAASKRADAFSKIPKEWRLPREITSQISKTSDFSVLEIPRTCGLLSSKELEITEAYTATALRDKIASGGLSAVAVTEAFCKRAAIAQQLTNCVTETMFAQAVERAKYLDSYFAQDGPIGPLHGLPISLKDSFNVKGVHSTLGLISFNKRPVQQENSPLVDILISLGAILHVKTNVPQTLMTADSDNNLFGRTLNPHNLCLTAGGSSGGEGAIVALRGSIIGVGTDIAGSIRIPSLCCGNYGFKPSVGRVPYGGQTGCSRPAAPGITAVAGPLAQSAQDCNMFLSAVLGAKPWDYDSTALATPWRNVPAKKSLRLGFITEDPAAPVSPPIARSLETAANVLADAGHVIIPLKDFPSLMKAQELAWRFFCTDPAFTVKRILQDGEEPPVPSVAKGLGLPTNRVTMDELFDISLKRRDLRQEWHQLFLKLDLDAVMLPAYYDVAPKHDEYGAVLYTLLQNLLDYPSSVIPFLTADKEIDDNIAPTYNVGSRHGLPCTIQLMARTLFDEELMSATQTVADVLKASQ